jgi:putative transposase
MSGEVDMSLYRRAHVAGASVFLTLVTHRRASLFEQPTNLDRLREALRIVQAEAPFAILAAVVLPDHLHFLWELPRGDTGYGRRVGRVKVLFTRSLRDEGVDTAGSRSASRCRSREADVWQRRFWEHTIRDEMDLEQHAHYIHYNPVKHGLVTCPHLWPNSSFRRWVAAGDYEPDWGCQCGGRVPSMPPMDRAESACAVWD